MREGRISQEIWGRESPRRSGEEFPRRGKSQCKVPRETTCLKKRALGRRMRGKQRGAGGEMKMQQRGEIMGCASCQNGVLLWVTEELWKSFKQKGM